LPPIRRAAASAIGALLLATASAPARADTLRLEIKDLAFAAPPAAPHAGDVIEWRNQDFVAHTVTARDGSFDVAIPPGQTGRITLQHAGQTPFYCRLHPTMTGLFDVQP
jgi:plastocyanin